MTLYFTFLLPLLLISFANGQQYGYQPQRVGYNRNPSQNRVEKFPWVVAVLDKRDLLTRYIGSGSLIKPNVVLTAVHILNDISESDLLVRAGEWNTSTTEDQQHADLEVLKIVRHEQFNRHNAENNVALIILKTEFRITDNIGIIGLYMGGGNRLKSCFFNGWGKEKWNSEDYPTTLKKTEIDIVYNDICAQRLGRKLSDRQFCGDGLQGKDCTGDGGAPVVCTVEANQPVFKQVGIVNWGVRKPGDTTPTIFTDVTTLLGWIDYQLRLPANFIPKY
ncbi:phenoloxidase-activating factor 2 [Drosophila takahashii]|uniref:phenoloxidase-activating factor 2 n=1 Tax=Drosophila takahashii TaxID=29030 RepID=UPI001CF9100C|nr:phenoloxidase-activating factor 2 [Drosophila takahashii]